MSKSNKIAQLFKYPILIVYVALSWKVLEAADVFIARFNLPENTFQWVSTADFIGLLIVLGLLVFRRSRKLKVLIVDDHAMVRSGLKNLLLQLQQDKSNFELLDEASNGFNALELVQKHRYDLVFTDINMPAMNGIDLCKNITKENSQVKVVAFSMLDDKVTEKKMLDAGASGYLLKSASLQEIQTAIDVILKGEKYFSNGLAPL